MAISSTASTPPSTYQPLRRGGRRSRAGPVPGGGSAARPARPECGCWATAWVARHRRLGRWCAGTRRATVVAAGGAGAGLGGARAGRRGSGAGRRAGRRPTGSAPSGFLASSFITMAS